jgi:hypothetical protein
MSRSGELRRALTEGDGETGGRCGDEELFGTSDGRVGAAEDRRGRELDRRLALRAGGDAQAAEPFDREWNSFGRTRAPLACAVSISRGWSRASEDAS